MLRIIYQMTSWLPLPMRKSEPLLLRQRRQGFRDWMATNNTIQFFLGEGSKLTSANTRLLESLVPSRDTKR